MAVAEPKLELTLCDGLVEAIAAALRGTAESRGMQLVVASTSDAVVANTNRKLLSKVVMELIGRAMHAAAAGEVRIGVRRGRAEGRNTVEISIAEPAAGAAPPVARNEPMPLAPSQALAAQLGGKLSIHHKEAGQGSTYVLQIPGL